MVNEDEYTYSSFRTGISRYSSDVLNCLFDGLETECDTVAANMYTASFYISIKRQLASNNSTVNGNLSSYSVQFSSVT